LPTAKNLCFQSCGREGKNRPNRYDEVAEDCTWTVTEQSSGRPEGGTG